MDSVYKRVIVGQAADVLCNSSGIPTPSIVWERLGSSLPINAVVNSGRLTITSVGAMDAGTYICKATNGEGDDSVSVQLDVIGK